MTINARSSRLVLQSVRSKHVVTARIEMSLMEHSEQRASPEQSRVPVENKAGKKWRSSLLGGKKTSTAEENRTAEKKSESHQQHN